MFSHCCLSKDWNLSQTLFQYEEYAQIVEVLDLDKIQESPKPTQFYDDFETAI